MNGKLFLFQVLILDYIDKNRVNPLTCGDDAKNKWGTDGYYEGHWCNTMRKYYNPKVVIYEGGNYTGRRLELDPGTYDFNFINSKGFNDVISSLTVPPGWKVEAWEHNPGEGRRSVYTADTNWVGDANDTFSSLVITSNENSNLFQKLDNTNCVHNHLYKGYRKMDVIMIINI